MCEMTAIASMGLLISVEKGHGIVQRQVVPSQAASDDGGVGEQQRCGDAQNQAICTAALGDHCAFYGRVSSGYPGPRLKMLLEAAGVDTSLMILADDCVTSDILCLILKDGHHRFLTGERRCWGLRDREIDPGIIASARALSIGSLYGLDSLDRDGAKPLEAILKTCREAGTLTVADMNLDMYRLGQRHYDGIYRYIEETEK